MSEAQCNICGAPRADDAETASVRSNVRRFREEQFALWRCDNCRSIHARDEVDLAHYYAAYPVFAAELDWKLGVVYANMLRRLQHAGLEPQHRVLDYGCGGGYLVRYLQSRGFEHVAGWDRYNEEYANDDVLNGRYDCIVSQDVIEHVDSPNAMLRELDGMAAPGAIISIGTPDADVLDLTDPDDYVHALHQPYHRHILSAAALREQGEKLGWSVVRHYSTMYNNTLFPTMNPRFVLHYVRCHDDTFDLVTEPIRADSWKLWTPVTLFFALFGYFFDRHTDIQTVFRVGDRAESGEGAR
jgi:2-polyprenyl-3-methyl-5-hydroxy-6-metoxy-1,4-benzoquinol methylase